jgi:sirohydrochlorin cobaltochelatase
MERDTGSRPAIVVLGHGSQRGRATDEGIREVARRLQARFPEGPPVRPAFFEFLSPTLIESSRSAVESGATAIFVLPYFLFDGKEIQRDIPREIDRVRDALPGTTLSQLPNLGVDFRLARLVAARARAALLGTSQYLPAQGLVRRGADGRLGVVLVNRGSRSQWDSGKRLEALGKLVRSEVGGDTIVVTAQAENSERTIEAAARELADSGAGRIVVAPYLHFPGKVLAKNVIPALERSRDAYPAIQFCLAWTLCVDDTIVDILHDRVREAGLLENR